MVWIGLELGWMLDCCKVLYCRFVGGGLCVGLVVLDCLVLRI